MVKLFLIGLGVLSATSAWADTALVEAQVAKIAADSAIVSAIKAQNVKHANLTNEEILALDNTWRAEVTAGSGSMTEAAMQNTVSKALLAMKEASDGQFAEIFVMDNKGLNVGQSDLTSDYWQGDEAKFQRSYGENTVFADEVEFDDSAQEFIQQISSVITDPATGETIGAVTFGVVVE